jgi:hypothetical protein
MHGIKVRMPSRIPRLVLYTRVARRNTNTVAIIESAAAAMAERTTHAVPRDRAGTAYWPTNNRMYTKIHTNIPL